MAYWDLRVDRIVNICYSFVIFENSIKPAYVAFDATKAGQRRQKLKNNGLGKTEKSIMAFVRKHIGKRIFFPADLVKAGYQGEHRVMLNTLPRLAKKGYLERLFKGTYRLARAGHKTPKKEEKLVMRAPGKKLTPEEWKMKISSHLNKVSEAVASCDTKCGMLLEQIKDAQEQIEDQKRQKKELEKELEKWRKIDDFYRTNPQEVTGLIELFVESEK